jgi:hypothetical protein
MEICLVVFSFFLLRFLIGHLPVGKRLVHAVTLPYVLITGLTAFAETPNTGESINGKIPNEHIYVGPKVSSDVVPASTNASEVSMQHYRDGLGLQATNLAAAVDKYEKAMRIDPSNWEALNHYAWFLGVTAPVEYRDTGRALDLALRAAEVTAWSNRDVIDTVAEVYFLRGEIDKAIDVERKALLPGVSGKSKEKYIKGQLAKYEKAQGEAGQGKASGR